MGDEGLEEGNLACIFTHHGKVNRVASKGAGEDGTEEIGGEGLAG